MDGSGRRVSVARGRGGYFQGLTQGSYGPPPDSRNAGVGFFEGHANPCANCRVIWARTHGGALPTEAGLKILEQLSAVPWSDNARVSGYHKGLRRLGPCWSGLGSCSVVVGFQQGFVCFRRCGNSLLVEQLCQELTSAKATLSIGWMTILFHCGVTGSC